MCHCMTCVHPDVHPQEISRRTPPPPMWSTKPRFRKAEAATGLRDGYKGTGHIATITVRLCE